MSGLNELRNERTANGSGRACDKNSHGIPPVEENPEWMAVENLMLLRLLWWRRWTRRRRGTLLRLRARRLRSRLHLGRRQDQMQRVAFLPRTKLHDALVADVLD